MRFPFCTSSWCRTLKGDLPGERCKVIFCGLLVLLIKLLLLSRLPNSEEALQLLEDLQELYVDTSSVEPSQAIHDSEASAFAMMSAALARTECHYVVPT